MWFGIIIFGILHGFVLLPVILSFLGPLNKKPTRVSDEEKDIEKTENGYTAAVKGQEIEERKENKEGGATNQIEDFEEEKGDISLDLGGTQSKLQ